jgi:hypothetical protein
MRNIGAEAAHWAGLQIDLLQKYRADQVTAEHLEWFLYLRKPERDQLVAESRRPPIIVFDDLRGPGEIIKPAQRLVVEDGFFGGEAIFVPEPSLKSIARFVLLADLDTVTVPDNYNHVTQLTTFYDNHKEKFYHKNSFSGYNKNVTDTNFSKATTQLTAGQKIHVRVWKQADHKTPTTSEERMAFLAEQNSIYTGAQGLSLVFEQKRNQLLRSYHYVSYDEKYALWENAEHRFCLPKLFLSKDGHFDLGLKFFESPCFDNYVFLSFHYE